MTRWRPDFQANVASRRVGERAGGVLEGVLRNRVRVHGRSYNFALYVLTPEDFHADELGDQPPASRKRAPGFPTRGCRDVGSGCERKEGQGLSQERLPITVHDATAAIAAETMAPAGKTGVRRAAAIMFTDIVGFTQTTERLGDELAYRVLQSHNVMVRSRVTTHSGREVKTMGDGFLTTFPSVGAALGCAASIQSDLDDHNDMQQEAISVRIGVHVGSVIRTQADIHGWNVILAARIAQLAKGGEVLVSQAARSLAERSGRFRFGPPHPAELPGMSGVHLVHALLWRLSIQASRVALAEFATSPRGGR